MIKLASNSRQTRVKLASNSRQTRGFISFSKIVGAILNTVFGLHPWLVTMSFGVDFLKILVYIEVQKWKKNMKNQSKMIYFIKIWIIKSMQQNNMPFENTKGPPLWPSRQNYGRSWVKSKNRVFSNFFVVAITSSKTSTNWKSMNFAFSRKNFQKRAPPPGQ